MHWLNTLWDLALGLLIYIQIWKEPGREKWGDGRWEINFVAFLIPVEQKCKHSTRDAGQPVNAELNHTSEP